MPFITGLSLVFLELIVKIVTFKIELGILTIDIVLPRVILSILRIAKHVVYELKNKNISFFLYIQDFSYF